MADDEHATPRFAATPTRTEYAVTKGAVALAVYRKRMGVSAPGQPPRPLPIRRCRRSTWRFPVRVNIR